MVRGEPGAGAGKNGAPPAEHGAALLRVLVTLLVLGLLGAVGYLAASINHGRYRLETIGRELVVERGLFFPLGFDAYVPEAESLRAAYAPIELPRGATVDTGEMYSERGDLDRAIFGLLAGWARNRMADTSVDALLLASSYLARADLLPALSEQQRAELHNLRGDLAHRHALARIADVGADLTIIYDELQLAERLGAIEPAAVRGLVAELDQVSSVYRALAAKAGPPSPPSAGQPGDATAGSPPQGTSSARRLAPSAAGAPPAPAANDAAPGAASADPGPTAAPPSPAGDEPRRD